MMHEHLAGLPTDLSNALESTYAEVINHFLREEWDDAQVDGGRFVEAVVRYIEWKLDGAFTPIDGRSKPNRSAVLARARNDQSKEASIRDQIPRALELVASFRNNRNSAHLGNINPNKLDASCVMENVTWVMGEMARLESGASNAEIRQALDRLADRVVPLVQTVNDTPVVLDPTMSASDRALVLLYQAGEAVPLPTLRLWAGYTHSTQWRRKVIDGLKQEKLVFVDAEGLVHLLRPGEARAQQLLISAGAVAA